MKKFIIRNGFFKTEIGSWVNFSFVNKFFIEDNCIKFKIADESYIALEFESNEKAQNALDMGFNIYKGHDIDLFDMCYELQFYFSIRTEKALKNHRIITVGDFFEFVEAGIQPYGIGFKSWEECKTCYKQIKAYFM